MRLAGSDREWQRLCFYLRRWAGVREPLPEAKRLLDALVGRRANSTMKAWKFLIDNDIVEPAQLEQVAAHIERRVIDQLGQTRVPGAASPLPQRDGDAGGEPGPRDVSPDGG